MIGNQSACVNLTYGFFLGRICFVSTVLSIVPLVIPNRQLFNTMIWRLSERIRNEYCPWAGFTCNHTHTHTHENALFPFFSIRYTYHSLQLIRFKLNSIFWKTTELEKQNKQKKKTAEASTFDANTEEKLIEYALDSDVVRSFFFFNFHRFRIHLWRTYFPLYFVLLFVLITINWKMIATAMMYHDPIIWRCLSSSPFRSFLFVYDRCKRLCHVITLETN